MIALRVTRCNAACLAIGGRARWLLGRLDVA